MLFSSLDSSFVCFFRKNKKRLFFSTRIGILIVFILQIILPAYTFAALDIYRNADTGFIELGQSTRVNGNLLTTGNLTLT